MSSDYIIKVLTLGDTAVGTTSIILRYTKSNFPKKAISTIGVDFRSKIVDLPDRKKAKILLWDTAGQERFRTVANNYYNGTDCVLLVFDLTTKSSFTILNYWIEQLEQKKRLEDVCLILVGNKSDLEDQIKVTQEEIEAFTNQYKMKYFEVSALKNEGIDELFKYGIEETLKLLQNKSEKEKGKKNERISHISQNNNEEKGKCCN